MDPEQPGFAEKQFLNAPVETLSWTGLTVTVKESKTGQPKTLPDNVEGIVQAGECCALMGPSGCGKTTFLNVLAQQAITKASHVGGQILVNGNQVPASVFRHVTSFVQDHDIFIGALNAKETLHFASRLAGISHGGEAKARVDALLESFGLVDQTTSRVETGLSHGQKRRLTVANQLVTGPSILFLDEPTSGLDSVASCHVISYLRQLAKRTGLSSQLIDYYTTIGVTVPERANPADFLLELVNTDFVQNQAAASERERVAELASRWDTSALRQRNHEVIVSESARRAPDLTLDAESKPTFLAQLVVLIHRSFIKAFRDAMAYNWRLTMYASLGVLQGTIWLRMDRDQDSIQLLINALLVSCGFMAFLAITYVPAFLEDYRQFRLDRRNGLYDAGSFLLSNLIVGLPYVFLFSWPFSLMFYFLGNLRHSASAFFTWTAWLYLKVLAAEGVVILSVVMVPNFVGAMVVACLWNVVAFATAGVLVPPAHLNAFYKYVFYYWNYQGYVFQDQCHIAGETVLDQFGVKTADQGRNVRIVVAIILGYRLAAWILLKMRH
ncbi:P-loop containing nucleoside triphosphate hydrolase protein [Parachaetomium inaequale]|uniref:P-loop containing nucleoside triphosphate hydrolase protein n=1 Tax=Parachaetomium inaequale TaxID=2588326 RepID=A0AAN6PIZ6_9PEZI|nr:P-loop containing nucleoside triphosphate hydrolase protein [Parachaetomium inaequale]